MFNFLKSKNLSGNPTPPSQEPNKDGWLQRLSKGLKKTRHQLVDNLATLLIGKKAIDENLLEALETLLLTADVGVSASQKILAELTNKVARRELTDPQILETALKEILINMLQPCTQSLTVSAQPTVLLMVGVNGAGKTTSIAKIAHYYQNQGKKILIAAGDTFRAAAVEQLQVWGERNNISVISQQSGADSASVVYDALQAAIARKTDLLIADTAGRLHTQTNLISELQKIKRVMTKLDPLAPHEIMLVIDASMGQNALIQAQQFHEAVGVTGITLTKLDGTAKGGILFAICEKLQLPIRFIGVGEQLEDLKPFDAKEFVEALFMN